MASVDVRIDMAKLKKAVNNAEGLVPLLERRSAEIAAKANSLSSGFRTGRYHVDHKSPPVGGTAPVYLSNVRDMGKGPVGIVHTGNYAAMKDNHQNNTLLKAR